MNVLRDPLGNAQFGHFAFLKRVVDEQLRAHIVANVDGHKVLFNGLGLDQRLPTDSEGYSR